MTTTNSSPLTGAGNHKRSTTVPTKLQSPFLQTTDSSEESEEVLYTHNKATVYRLGKSPFIRSSTSPQSPGSAPWKTGGDTLAGLDCVLKLKSPAQSAPYLQAREARIAMMPGTEMWCVDNQSKFATSTYRIELPYDTDEDKKSVDDFKEALKKIIQYESTPCPFKRLSETHAESPETLGSPQRKPTRKLIGRKRDATLPSLDGRPHRNHSDLARRFSYQSSLQSTDVSEDEEDLSVEEADAYTESTSTDGDVVDQGIAEKAEVIMSSEPQLLSEHPDIQDQTSAGQDMPKADEPPNDMAGEEEDEDSSDSQNESSVSQNNETLSSSSDAVAAEPLYNIEKSGNLVETLDSVVTDSEPAGGNGLEQSETKTDIENANQPNSSTKLDSTLTVKHEAVVISDSVAVEEVKQRQSAVPPVESVPIVEAAPKESDSEEETTDEEDEEDSEDEGEDEEDDEDDEDEDDDDEDEDEDEDDEDEEDTEDDEDEEDRHRREEMVEENKELEPGENETGQTDRVIEPLHSHTSALEQNTSSIDPDKIVVSPGEATEPDLPSSLRLRNTTTSESPPLSRQISSSSSISRPLPGPIQTAFRQKPSPFPSFNDPNSYLLSRIVEVLTSPPSRLFGVFFDFFYGIWERVLYRSESWGGGTTANLKLPPTPGGWAMSNEESEPEDDDTDANGNGNRDSDEDVDDFDVPLGNDSAAKSRRANWSSSSFRQAYASGSDPR